MKRTLFSAALLLLAFAGRGAGQVVVPTPEPPIVQERIPSFVRFDRDPRAGEAVRTKVSVDYLRWWVSGGPVGVPLVTTSPVAGGGAITDPNTSVLFGNSNVDFGGINGGRVNATWWFDSESRFGIEANGFLFRKANSTFTASSDQGGNPLLAFPFQTPAGVETSQLISTPGLPAVGAVSIASSSQLWGAEFNCVVNLYRGCGWSFDFLSGFRYLDLLESLEITSTSSFTVTPVRQNPINVTGVIFDQFSTRNQFYGGNLGGRASYQWGRLSAEVLSEIALGVTRHKLYTGGYTDATANGAVIPSAPGGVYTKTSNLGNFNTSSFSIVPQVQVKLGYNITRNVRATVGYDLLYWTNVNRPGNQIDRVIGPQPGDRPMALNNQSNFWAHGFNAGLEFQW